MPCDTIRSVSLDLNIVDREALLAALKKLGLEPEEWGNIIGFYLDGNACRIARGTITVPEGREAIVNEIKQETSRQIVERVAARNKWQIKKVNKNKYQVVRRH